MVAASGSITTLDVVIDLAIEMENHGRNYYAQAREKTKDPKCKEFFSWLVEQEEDHHQTYLRLLQDSSISEISQEELTGGYGQFIQRLVKEVTERLAEGENLSVEEVIEHSIYFEESVIDYFQKVISLFPEDKRKIIQVICDEEQTHIDAIRQYRVANNI